MAKILVIDDERTIVMALKEVLSDEGYEVFTAVNGKAGLEQLKQGLVPDLLIIDLFMPEMGGRDFIEKIREDYKLGDMAVILITGTIPDGDNFPLDGTYQEIISKPFDLDNVVEKVACLLKRRQAGVSNPVTHHSSLPL